MREKVNWFSIILPWLFALPISVASGVLVVDLGGICNREGSLLVYVLSVGCIVLWGGGFLGMLLHASADAAWMVGMTREASYEVIVTILVTTKAVTTLLYGRCCWVELLFLELLVLSMAVVGGFLYSQHVVQRKASGLEK